jgi:hypothetical protein
LYNTTTFDHTFYVDGSKETNVNTDFAKYIITSLNNTNKWVETKNNNTKLSISKITSTQEMFRY